MFTFARAFSDLETMGGMFGDEDMLNATQTVASQMAASLELIRIFLTMPAAVPHFKVTVRLFRAEFKTSSTRASLSGICRRVNIFPNFAPNL